LLGEFCPSFQANAWEEGTEARHSRSVQREKLTSLAQLFITKKRVALGLFGD
jgi:hypothetical protein